MSVRAAVIVVALVGSCSRPAAPDGETRIVTAKELARAYRDEPSHAAITFTNQLVRVRLAAIAPGPDPLVLGWQPFYGAEPYPPAVVFRFTDPIPAGLKPPVWVEGLCAGRLDDGLDRGLPGYTFRVIVTGCRVVPPTPPGAP